MSFNPSSYTDYTVTNVTTTQYGFTKEILQSSHIRVFNKPLSGNWSEITDFETTGSSGLIVVTLGPSVSLALNSTLRILRDTPRTGSTRLVDFANGDGLSEDDLDTSALQNLYIAQEAIDAALSKCLTSGQESDGGTSNYNANFLLINNLGAPTGSYDAARKIDVDNAVLSQGSLPTPTTGDLTNILMVGLVTGTPQWTAISAAVLASAAGIKTAAYYDTGVSNTNIVQLGVGGTISSGVDGRYMTLTGNSATYGRAYSNAIIGISSGSIPTGESTVNINNIVSSYMNTLIGTDTSNDLVIVEGNGVSMEVNLVVGNSAVTGSTAFYVKLEKDANASPTTLWQSQNFYVTGGGARLTSPYYFKRHYFGTNDSPEYYRVKIAETGSSLGLLRLVTGDIVVQSMS